MVCALGLEDDALQLLEDRKLLIGIINFGVALLFRDEEAYFLEALEFALYIAGILLDKLRKAANVCLKVGILSINYNDFPTNP